jgi:hypothetical protein
MSSLYAGTSQRYPNKDGILGGILLAIVPCVSRYQAQLYWHRAAVPAQKNFRSPNSTLFATVTTRCRCTLRKVSCVSAKGLHFARNPGGSSKRASVACIRAFGSAAHGSASQDKPSILAGNSLYCDYYYLCSTVLSSASEKSPLVVVTI